MDFINEQQVSDKIVTPALNKITNEVVPALERAVGSQVAAAAAHVSVIIAGALEAIQSTVDRAAADLRGEIAALDGWTLEIAPITISAISIRLSKPKES